MQNELISPAVEQKILNDLQRLIDTKKAGKLLLKNYIAPAGAGPCMDFAMLYESSDALQALVREAVGKGIGIEILEDQLRVQS